MQTKAVVSFLGEEAPQKRLKNYLKNQSESELFRLFEDLNQFEHPEITSIIESVDEGNKWEGYDLYFHDILLVVYNFLFENHELKPEIKKALINDDPKISALFSDEKTKEEIYRGILVAFFSKMILNTSQQPLLERLRAPETVEDAMEFQLEFNKHVDEYIKGITFEKTKKLSELCAQFGQDIFESFNQLISQIDLPESDTLSNLTKLINSAQTSITPAEIIHCQHLVLKLLKEHPGIHLDEISVKISQAYLTIWKTLPLPQEVPIKLIKELEVLRHDLSSVILEWREQLQLYYRDISAFDDKNARKTVDTINTNLGQMKTVLDSIDAATKDHNLNLQQVISLKLELMSAAISLSLSEIAFHRSNLQARKDDLTTAEKIQRLDEFQQVLISQQSKIHDKLQSHEPYTRTDYQEVVKAVSAKRKEFASLTHSSWFFWLLSKLTSKLGFKIKTHSEAIMKEAEERLSMTEEPHRSKH